MKTVLILDDDADLGELMRELLLVLGAERCTLAHSVKELRELPREQSLGADVALLDVNLGPGEDSGVDAYRWLLDQGYRGEIVFLTGHAQGHPLIKQALELPNVTLLAKPATSNQLEALLR